MQYCDKIEKTTFKAWRIWIIAAFFVFYQYILQSSTSVLATPLSQEFNLTSIGISALASAYFYSYIVLQVPAGMAIDKFGPRKVLLWSMPIATIMVVVYALAPTVEIAFIARFIMGAAFASGLVTGMYLSAQWFAPQRFALMAGLIETLCMLGGGLGQQMLSFGVEAVGWRMTMLITSTFGVLLFYFAWLYIYDTPPPPPKLSTQQIIKINPLKTVLTSQMSWIAALYAGLVGAVMPAFAGLWGIHYLQATHHISLTAAAVGTALVFFGLAISSPMTGVISDKIGLRKPVMYYAAWLAFILFTVFIYAPNLSLYAHYTLLFFIGLSCGASVLGFSVAKETIPQSCQATVIGFVNMVALGVGAWIYIPGIAFILEYLAPHAGSLRDYQPEHYQSALTSLPAGILLAIFLLPFVKETYCRNLQQHTAMQKNKHRAIAMFHLRARRSINKRGNSQE